jgi:hypothetical protein
MADFSKQWCEINNPSMISDFDILEQAELLKPNHYVSMICEGFGFIAIAKGENNEVLLGFVDDQDNVKWEDYNNVIK